MTILRIFSIRQGFVYSYICFLGFLIEFLGFFANGKISWIRGNYGIEDELKMYRELSMEGINLFEGNYGSLILRKD